MTTTPVATAATGQPEWARCRGRGEQSLHCAFVARFPVVGSSKAGRIGLVHGRFSHQLEAHAAMLLAPIPLIMGNLGGLRWKDGRGPDGGGAAARGMFPKWPSELTGSSSPRAAAPQRRLPATAVQAPRPASSPSVVWIACAIQTYPRAGTICARGLTVANCGRPGRGASGAAWGCPAATGVGVGS